MIEFGEQLRRAREAKGMTQQSLAEQLYVTRQSVSRWECGDRYPDLITTKKISQILDVSLDDLLSGKEMEKVAERNPVIENKTANHIMIVLYSFVVLSFMVTVVDILIGLQASEAAKYSDIHVIAIWILALAIQIAAFLYGLFHAVKGTLAPKRMGAVIAAYYAAICITNVYSLLGFTGPLRWQMVVSGAISMIIPNIVGAIASYFYFIRYNKHALCINLIVITSIWGIFRSAFTIFTLLRTGGRYLSMNTTLEFVLKTAIYGLILYQTYTLHQKRRKAAEISGT